VILIKCIALLYLNKKLKKELLYFLECKNLILKATNYKLIILSFKNIK